MTVVQSMDLELPPFVESWIAAGGVSQLLTVAAVMTAVALVARWARGAAAAHIADADLRYRVRKIIAFVAFAVSVLILLGAISGRTSGLTVAFGVAGAGVAFALQEVIASTAGWVAVLSGSYYSPGDRVQLGGIKGDVIDIGVLRTTLMECGQWVDGDLYNGRIVRVANSFVFKEPVVNYSADFPFLWDEIKVPVTYASDRRKVRAMLEAIVEDVTRDTVADGRRTWGHVVRKYRIEDARIEPMVHLVATDNWVEFTIRYIVDFRRRRATRDVLFARILDAFDASNGAAAMASATFAVVSIPKLAVTVQDQSAT